MIDGNFPNGATRPQCKTGLAISSSVIPNYFPEAKIGHGNYIYISYMNSVDVGNSYSMNGWSNYFGIAQITSVAVGNMSINSNANIPVIEAYKFDTKIDDGIPNTGSVIVGKLSGGAGDTNFGTWSLTENSTGSFSTSCDYVTAFTTPNTMVYNMGGVQNSPNSPNCALAVQMK